jgi:transposase
LLLICKPKVYFSSSTKRLGNITKQGDRYLRSLLTAGALAMIRIVKIYGVKHRQWLGRSLERRSTKVAAIPLANKLARMAADRNPPECAFRRIRPPVPI